MKAMTTSSGIGTVRVDGHFVLMLRNILSAIKALFERITVSPKCTSKSSNRAKKEQGKSLDEIKACYEVYFFGGKNSFF